MFSVKTTCTDRLLMPLSAADERLDSALCFGATGFGVASSTIGAGRRSAVIRSRQSAKRNDALAFINPGGGISVMERRITYRTLVL